MDQQAHFSLLSYQLVYFEEEFKEEKWVDVMNKEIEAIERTTHGILWISLHVKLELELNGCIRQNSMRKEK